MISLPRISRIPPSLPPPELPAPWLPSDVGIENQRGSKTLVGTLRHKSILGAGESTSQSSEVASTQSLGTVAPTAYDPCARQRDDRIHTNENACIPTESRWPLSQSENTVAPCP